MDPVTICEHSMMGFLYSRNSLQRALTATVLIVVVLTTWSTRECRLQTGQKLKDGSAILTTSDIILFQIQCIDDSCRQSHDASKMIGNTGGSSVHRENHPKDLKTSCGSKVCNTSSVCLRKGCSNVCVQVSYFCDLHMASKTGDLAKVKVILSQGWADMNCKRWNRRSPMLLAAGEGHRDVVHLLISNGASLSVVDDFGINILHSACQGGDVALVKYILSLGKHDINEKVLCGGTAIMLAAENGHWNVVKLLVGEGANVLLQDNKGNNILHFACRGGHVDVVNYVLSENMADINSRGWRCMTPMMMAAQNGHGGVVELLVGQGANVTLQDNIGNNILHYACRGGDVEVVKYVLSLGMVDVNCRGWKDMTPVMMAAVQGHRLEVVELLVRKGSEISLKGVNQNNILHYACRSGDVEVVKYVLSLDMMDINSRGWNNMTCMMTAAKNGHQNVVELLWRKGANALLHDNKGNNILHLACRRGNVEVVKYVLSKNMVDMNSRNRKGKTPVMMAADRKHLEVVELLESKGGNRTLEDNEQ